MDLSNLSGDDLQAIAEGRMKDVSDEALHQITLPDPGHTWKDKALAVADVAGRTLDYPAGITRAGIAKVTGLGKEGDMMNALTAHPPSSDEILGRAGVPDNAGRGVAGFALDVAADPLNFVSLGGTGALRKLLQKATGAAGKGLEIGGKAAYKSARNLQVADKVATEAGKIPVSDILFKAGVTGTSEGMAKQVPEVLQELVKKRDALVAEAGAAGATADLSKVDDALKSLHDEWFAPGAASEFNPAKAEAYNKAVDVIQGYTQHMANAGGGSPSQLKDLLTSVYQNELGPAAYQTGKTTPEMTRVLKKGAQGMKEGYTSGIEKAIGPDKANEVASLNEQLSSLLSGQKKMMTEGGKTASKVGLSPIDTAMAAINPGIALAKKGGDVLGTTWVRTKGGKAASDIGKKLSTDSAWNKMLATPAGQRALVDLLKQNGEQDGQ